MADLTTDVRYVKGVGEARAKQLEKLGIKTLFDLVNYFPLDYEDRTKLLCIEDMEPGQSACFRAYVMTSPRTARLRNGLDLTRCRIADDTGALNATFFNNRFMAEKLVRGGEYVFYGALSQDSEYKFQITNPVFEPVESAGTVTRRIVPVYRLTAGLSNNQLIKAIAGGMVACGDLLPDCLPADIRQKYNLCHAGFAYENIHCPTSAEALDIARRRLIFEEFFVFSAGLLMLKSRGKKVSEVRLNSVDITEFYSVLPFSLTNAQQRAIQQSLSDMSSGYVMNRLVQGDVGSGKTVVAAAAGFAAFKNGLQSALMAPTEILAGQHFKSLAALLEPLGMKVILLTGGMKAAAKRNALELIELGMADLVVGTHSLISEAVKFKSLGLVIADEQHRFGVAQRAALSEKGAEPHVLVMSATPIPRTLALMMYGDLDVSVIDELPPGRQSIDTFLVDEAKRQRIYAFINREVAQGRQAYIVCPMVDEGGTEDVKSAEGYAKELAEGPLSTLKVGLVHGKLKASAKEAVMSAFSRGELDVLVSTTVIEVGVDVPNATLMIIENAERFGLSQLHQLRGRVGRGQHKSYCVMFSSAKKDDTLARLKVMCKTGDGFKIAEEDLKLRGPGDFFGSRQHGLPSFKIADLASNTSVLYEARQAAGEYLDSGSVDTVLMNRIKNLFEESGNIFN